MGYVIHFVGLVNFFDPSANGVQVLLPDGRVNDDLPGDIEPHRASFFIEPGRVDDKASDWWQDSPFGTIGVNEFPIMKASMIEISGQTQGTLDYSQQERYIDKLKAINPNIDIDPAKAETIAQLRLRNGTLEAFEVSRALMSTLTVASHSGPVTITATPKGGGKKKLVVNEGTEIVLANISDLNAKHSGKPEDDHFLIYGKLDAKRDYPALIHKLGSVHPRLPKVASRHPFIDHINVRFLIPLPGCSNVGCCVGLCEV